MRIGELARVSGLTTRTIRFYEQAGVLTAPARQSSGYRDYDDSAVGRLAFVKAAQAAGLTLAEVRNVISARDTGGPPCEHVTTLLEAHLTELDRRIAGLTTLRAEVRRLCDRAGTVDPSRCGSATVCDVIPTASPAAGQR